MNQEIRNKIVDKKVEDIETVEWLTMLGGEEGPDHDRVKKNGVYGQRQCEPKVKDQCSGQKEPEYS